MIVDWQREPIKDQLIHIDLKRIALDKPCASACASSCSVFRWASRPPAAFSTRFCAKWKSSACLPTFPATSTWMSATWRCIGVAARQRSAALGQDQVPELPKTRPWPTLFRSVKKRRPRPRPRLLPLAAAAAASAAEPEVAKKGKPDDAAKTADAAPRSPRRRSKPWPKQVSLISPASNIARRGAGVEPRRGPFLGGRAWQSRGWSICGRRITRGSWPSTASPSKRALWCRTGAAGP